MHEGPGSILTTGQAAKLCSVSPDTILKWIKKGRIQGSKTAGGHYRVALRDIEPLIADTRHPGQHPWRGRELAAREIRCWDYPGHDEGVRDACRKCVVYRARAARCYLLAELNSDVGHARRFCENSCDECAFYRQAKGLAPRVLVITADDDLIAQLEREETERVCLRFAHNAYEASTAVQAFRPAFVVIDIGRSLSWGVDLLKAITADVRVPGLRVVAVIPAGTSDRRESSLRTDRVISTLRRPFGAMQIVEAIESCSTAAPGLPSEALP